MDVKKALHQAIAFRQTADDLQAWQNQLIPKSGPTWPFRMDDTWTDRIVGYSFSATILRALATETMLKVLAFRKTGTYRTDGKGHDLLTLFTDLDSGTQQCIERVANENGFESPRDILEKHRSDFIEWRYPMEHQQMQTETQDLDKVLTVLMLVNGPDSEHTIRRPKIYMKSPSTS